MSDILSELVKNQLHDVPSEHRLKITDMMRIADRVSSSVFNPSLCSVWLSYISNLNRPEKGVSVNFFFKGRKVLLHRLLYINYVCKDFDSSYYLKRKCRNYECVNVSHYYSVKYEGAYRSSIIYGNRTEQAEKVKAQKQNYRSSIFCSNCTEKVKVQKNYSLPVIDKPSFELVFS